MSDTAKALRDWGVPPWRVGRFSAPPALPARVDVAIIGGGLTGVSAAYHLARAGLRTALFEADRIGSGASGRTGGLVLEGTATGPRDGTRDCVPRLRTLVAELGIECDLQLPGCWEIEHRTDAGLRAIPWTDAGEGIAVARTVPGGVVEPGALTAGLAEAAVKAGAVIYERNPIEELTLAAPIKLKVKGQEIVADHVIVALNAWTLATLPQLADVRSALTYACVTEPLEEAVLAAIGLGQRIPFYTADTPYLWGRVCADRSVVFGAGLTFGGPAELENVRVTEGEAAAVLTRLVGRVKSLHPALARVGIAARWGGPIAFREGLMPLLTRHPANDHILVAGAYAGHGVAFSVRAGALMAAAIVDGAALPSWGGI
jgi:gamma-glutamylputrescine oxidase